MMDDVLVGYALVWNAMSAPLPSSDGARGEWREVVPRGSVTISPRLIVDCHHFFYSGFAFISDNSTRVYENSYGLSFEADLPETATGYDIRKGLAANNGQLGVSVVYDALAHDWTRNADNELIGKVSAATVVAISIMTPGHHLFPEARCWLGRRGELVGETRRVSSARGAMARSPRLQSGQREQRLCPCESCEQGYTSHFVGWL
jgi:hypothetical protein